MRHLFGKKLSLSPQDLLKHLPDNSVRFVKFDINNILKQDFSLLNEEINRVLKPSGAFVLSTGKVHALSGFVEQVFDNFFPVDTEIHGYRLYALLEKSAGEMDWLGVDDGYLVKDLPTSHVLEKLISKLLKEGDIVLDLTAGQDFDLLDLCTELNLNFIGTHHE